MTFGLCTTGVTVNLCGFWLPAFPSPFWVCVSVSMGSGEYFPLNFLQCDGPSWRLHAGVVPTRGVAMDTSLLCLSCSGSRPTFKAPVPKLISEMSLIILAKFLKVLTTYDHYWNQVSLRLIFDQWFPVAVVWSLKSETKHLSCYLGLNIATFRVVSLVRLFWVQKWTHSLLAI